MQPPPKTGFLARLERVRRIGGPPRWKDTSAKRLYEWIGVHEELEVYDRRGRHLGVVDPSTGRMIKPAVKGRTIDV